MVSQELGSLWNEHFQKPPTVYCRAPGRVNLIGEHTDYNEGFVFPAAIDRQVEGLFRIAYGSSRLISAQIGEAAPFVIGRAAGRTWARYAAACALSLLDAGYEPLPIEGVISSTLPPSSGLSSSAALELCLLSAWNALHSFGLNNAELAELAWNAETKHVGVQCGIMDQMVVALAEEDHAMFIDTRTRKTVQTLMPYGLEIAVLDTRTPRSLASAAYNERVAECQVALEHVKQRKPDATALRDAALEDLEGLEGVPLKRARHVITENSRVGAFRLALLANERAELSRLSAASHESLRDDYEVSSAALDAMVESASQAPGCVAVRLTGAGFGGCCVALVDSESFDAFWEATMASYLGRGYPNPVIFGTRAGQRASSAHL